MHVQMFIRISFLCEFLILFVQNPITCPTGVKEARQFKKKKTQTEIYFQ